MMSPAKASSSSSRRCDRKLTTVFGRSSLPERTTFSRMPRSKWPEATRTKAIRSRCAGSMLAWILKTTPLNFGSSGWTTRWVAARSRRRRRQVDQGVEHLAHAEVVDRRAEEHRRLPAGEEGVAVERRRGIARAARSRPRPARTACRSARRRPGCRGRRGSRRRRRSRSWPGLEHPHLLLAQVHHAVERLAHADRPGEGHDLHAELALDLLHQVERLLDLAVHLVDEGQDRRVARPADLQQAARLRLDAVGRVDHHQRRVDRGQHAVGVLGEVLVAGRVEQVDDRSRGTPSASRSRRPRCRAASRSPSSRRSRGARPCAPSPSRRSGSRRRTAAASRSAWSCPRRGGK